MKWLKRKIRNWLENDEYLLTESTSIKLTTNTLSSKGFKIYVYRANGGIVLETSVYDEHKDRTHNGLYVITDDDQLGDSIAKIITMENLKS